MLQDRFEKIFCINLKRRPDRLAQAKAHFAQFGIPVEFIEAVDGSLLPEPSAISKDGSKINRGEHGCILSHLMIATEAKRLGLRNYFVFEDDVDLSYDFNEMFDKFFPFVPFNYDMLYLGGNHEGGYTFMMPNVAKIHFTYALHAYGVNSSAYDRIINALAPANEKADVAIAYLHDSMNCYVFRPHLATQRPGYSDLLGKHTNYEHLKK